MCCMIFLTHNNDRRLFNGRAVVGRLLQSSPSQLFVPIYLLILLQTPLETFNLFTLVHLGGIHPFIHSYLTLTILSYHPVISSY